MFNRTVAISHPNFKFSFTIWGLGGTRGYPGRLEAKARGRPADSLWSSKFPRGFVYVPRRSWFFWSPAEDEYKIDPIRWG